VLSEFAQVNVSVEWERADVTPGLLAGRPDPRGAAASIPAVSASGAARRSRSALDATDPVAPGGPSIPEGVEGPEWWGIATVVSVMGVHLA
jgi:hypothetical protein